MPRRLLGALLVAALVAAIAAPAASARTNPTIVLVHGAFADASGFGAVTDRLRTAATRSSRPPTPSAVPRATPPTSPA